MNFSIDLVNREVVYGGALSQFWVPLSQAIVWGLAFASILTLIATPALLALPYRFRPLLNWLKAKSAEVLPVAVSARLGTERQSHTS
jgi:multidrug efflux pump